MRQTPVNDYLEEISTELPEELYGNLSDAIYETVCEFDEEVAQLNAENDRLRELMCDMYRSMDVSCQFGHAIPAGTMAHIKNRVIGLGVEVDA